MKRLTLNTPAVRFNPLYIGFIYVISLACSVMLFVPLVVDFMSNFTQSDTIDVIYHILRALLAVVLVASITCFTITKRLTVAVIPCVTGLVTVLFPLLDWLSRYLYYLDFCNKFSVKMDLSEYLIYMLIYLFIAILCILTVLYLLGFLKPSLVILILSVVTSLAIILNFLREFHEMDKSMYEFLNFVYLSPLCLLPMFAVMLTKQPTKTEKYKPKRMKQ